MDFLPRFSVSIFLFAIVGLAETGLSKYRLDVRCETDSIAIFGKIGEVVDRFGGSSTETVTPMDARKFSIPALGGDASIVEFTISKDAGSCRIDGVGAMTSPGVPAGVPSKVTDVPPPRMEFLMQAVHQQLSSAKPMDSPDGFPRLDGGFYAIQSLLVPYVTPFYIRDKVLGANKGIYMLAAFYVLMEASGVLLLATKEGVPSQRVIGITGLAFGRIFALGMGPIFSRMNRNFVATGYSYDPKKRHRLP